MNLQLFFDKVKFYISIEFISSIMHALYILIFIPKCRYIALLFIFLVWIFNIDTMKITMSI